MTNTVKLKELIDKSGLKLEYIASQIGITRFSLAKKIKNETEFKASEVQKMCEILCITDNEVRQLVFFAHNVD